MFIFVLLGQQVAGFFSLRAYAGVYWAIGHLRDDGRLHGWVQEGQLANARAFFFFLITLKPRVE